MNGECVIYWNKTGFHIDCQANGHTVNITYPLMLAVDLRDALDDYIKDQSAELDKAKISDKVKFLIK